MGLFANPLSYAGYPPGVTGTPTTQNASIRAATTAEAAAGTLTNCYISPATAESASSADFASPPVLGFGSTTPRPVHATTLDSTGDTSLGTGASSVVNVGVGTSTLGFFGATAIAKPGATADLKTSLGLLGLLTDGGATPLNLDGGALTCAAITSTSGGITATVGNITATDGNIVRGTAGNKDVYSSVATNGTAGANSAGTATLSGGTITINTTAVTASSIIRLYRQGVGATGAAALGILSTANIVGATSFDIRAVQPADATALQATDVSVVAWEIVN